MSEKSKNYELSLEFERWDLEIDETERERNYFFMNLTLPDGRCYDFNVWTYGVFESCLREAERDGENLDGLYMYPPDLFIRSMNRESCERAVEDMIARGTLPHTCRSHDSDDWEDWEDWSEADESSITAQQPVDLKAKRTYRLEWRGVFRLNRESKIPRMVKKLSRTIQCDLEIVKSYPQSGCFHVLMRSKIDDVTAAEAFWVTNQYFHGTGMQHINGPDIGEGIWRFEVFNPNPRGVPSLEFLTVTCDYQTL